MSIDGSAIQLHGEQGVSSDCETNEHQGRRRYLGWTVFPLLRRSGSPQSDARMIAVSEFHTLCLKNGTDFVLGFSRH